MDNLLTHTVLKDSQNLIQKYKRTDDKKVLFFFAIFKSKGL